MSVRDPTGTAAALRVVMSISREIDITTRKALATGSEPRHGEMSFHECSSAREMHAVTGQRVPLGRPHR